MASIDKRPDGSWRARWREFAGGPQRSQHFARKVDAVQHLTQINHDLATGRYVNPKAGQMTVAVYAAEWMARREKSWTAATRLRVADTVARYIGPTFGERPLASIRRAHVESWAAELKLAPLSVTTAASVLSSMLNAAAEDGRLAVNPARGARLPKVERPKVVPLTVEQVHALTAAVPDYLRAAVVLAAGTGLRQGEAMGLSLDRVDFLRRSMTVDRQLWSPPKGETVFAPPKTANSYRTVALADTVLAALAVHLERFGTGRDGLVFHRDEVPVTRNMLSRVMRSATKRAGLAGETWHSLRHHHASVLLSAGVSPVLVAERLGDTVATLLKTYAHVIRADEDRVRAIVDVSLGAGTPEDFLRTNGDTCTAGRSHRGRSDAISRVGGDSVALFGIK